MDIRTIGIMPASAFIAALLLVVCALAVPGEIAFAGDEGVGLEAVRGEESIQGTLPAQGSSSAREVMGTFDIPASAISSGTWGSDDYAAKWYLVDNGAGTADGTGAAADSALASAGAAGSGLTLVVGPGTIVSTRSTNGAVTPDFGGQRANIRTIVFTDRAFFLHTAASAFEGFTSLETIEGAARVSGEYGILNADRMFAGCAALKAIKVGDVTFSSNMEHPYKDEGVGITDVFTSCRDAFRGCVSLETLDLGKGWRSGYCGPPVFGPEDEIVDTRATFPVTMTDGKKTYAAGSPVPDGKGHYWRVSDGETTGPTQPGEPGESTQPGESGKSTQPGESTQPTKAKPTITVKTKHKVVKVAAAKKKARSFKIGARSSSGGKLSYHVVKSDPFVKFKAGKVTLKRGVYHSGITRAVKVRVTSAEAGTFAKASKTFKLSFKLA